MPLLSIIVPIYNVEPYFKKCLDSVLNQTFKDFELILIDDGSPDKCGEICDEYAKKDNRIIVIHKENGGVSSARNAGLEIATAKYVSFIDPDDYISEDMYELMINEAKCSKSDIVCVNWYNDVDEVISENNIHVDIPATLNRNDFVIHIFDSPRTLGDPLWNKLLLLNKNLTFNTQLAQGEDFLYLCQYVLQSKKISFINKPKYFSVHRLGSATRSGTRKRLPVLNVKKDVIKIFKKINKKSKNLAEKEYLDLCLIFYNNLIYENDNSCTYIPIQHLKRYVKRNFFSVLMNKEIYWKTRIMYLKYLF